VGGGTPLKQRTAWIRQSPIRALGPHGTGTWHQAGTGRPGTGIAAHAVTIHLPREVTIHLPRETLIPTPVFPVTTTYILHLHYPGRLSTGAGAR
jgi:hypothetical protein